MKYKVKTELPELSVVLCDRCLEWADEIKEDTTLKIIMAFDECEVCNGETHDDKVN